MKILIRIICRVQRNLAFWQALNMMCWPVLIWSPNITLTNPLAESLSLGLHVHDLYRYVYTWCLSTVSEYDCLLALIFASTNTGLPEFDHSARAQLQGLNNVLQHQMVPGYLEFQYLYTTLSCGSAQTPRVNAAFQYPCNRAQIKKNLSTCPELVQYPLRQVTFSPHLPMGNNPGKPCMDGV